MNRSFPFPAWLFKPSTILTFFSSAHALQRTIGFLAKSTCQKFLRAENAIVLSSGGLLVKSTAKRHRFSSFKDERNSILEGVDEESRMYYTFLLGPVEKRRKRLQNVSLKDMPLEVRRKEAKNRRT